MSNRQLREIAAGQAETWFVHMESGEATLNDHARLKSWLEADAAHRQAYAQVGGLCESIAGLKHLAAVEPLHRRRFGTFKITAAILVALGATWLLIAVLPHSPTRYATQPAEVRDVTLLDGSTVTLGAQSQIAVTYTDDERRVLLSGGEAFFAVRSDPGRPFLVEADGTLLRVVGTKFSVHTSQERITVAVAEGAVEVLETRSALLPRLRRDARTERLRLTAGQKLVVARHDGELREVKSVKAVEVDSWRHGHLVYEDVPLREVVADANRYSKARIEIASEALAQMSVTAAFRSDQIDLMLDGLSDLLPLAVERHSGGGEIVLRPKPKE